MNLITDSRKYRSQKQIEVVRPSRLDKIHCVQIKVDFTDGMKVSYANQDDKKSFSLELNLSK